MKVETQYDIGQIIKYQKITKNGKGEVIDTDIRVGIIDRILLKANKILYQAPADHGNNGCHGWVEEDDVLCVLVEKT